MFARILSQYWWMTLLRGLLWIVFGVIIFTEPGISLLTLTVLFGAFALVDGIGTVVTAIGGRKEHENWWVLMLGGLCGIGIGILTAVNPALTATVLLFYMAIWAIATGLLEMVAAVRLRKEISGEFWLALAGLTSIALGVLILARPAVGALSLLWIIAGYAVVFGITLILLSLRVRGFMNRWAVR